MIVNQNEWIMSLVEIKDQNTHYDLDKETGEITNIHVVETVRQVKKLNTYDEFIMVYLNDISSFINLDNATQMKVMALIWRDVPMNNSEGNIITVLKEDKEKWAKEINVSLGTINNAISALLKKHLIYTVSRSRYKLNPLFFFKGKLADRSKLLRFQVDYTIGDVPKESWEAVESEPLKENLVSHQRIVSYEKEE